MDSSGRVYHPHARLSYRSAKAGVRRRRPWLILIEQRGVKFVWTAGAGTSQRAAAAVPGKNWTDVVDLAPYIAVWTTTSRLLLLLANWKRMELQDEKLSPLFTRNWRCAENRYRVVSVLKTQALMPLCPLLQNMLQYGYWQNTAVSELMLLCRVIKQIDTW